MKVKRAIQDDKAVFTRRKSTLLFVGKYAPELTTTEFLQDLWEGTSVPHRQTQMTF